MNMVQIERAGRIMKNTITHTGKRYVCRIFDNGGATIDRYTIALKGYRAHNGRMVYPYLAAGVDPRGCSGHEESREFLTGRELGRRVSFESLPADVQKFIVQNI